MAADPQWAEKRKIAARLRYQNDPIYAAKVKQRATERQQRRMMSGEHLEYHRKYREENRESMREMWRGYKKNRYNSDPAFAEKCKAHNKASSKTDKHKERMKGWRAEKRRTDPNFRIADNCRRRINAAIAGKDKSANTLALLGCTLAELKLHLESKWTPGMSWMTYGKIGWEIDHVKPCDSFDLSDPAQQRACFHFTNLQPMWRELNQSKGNRESPRLTLVPNKVA